MPVYYIQIPNLDLLTPSSFHFRFLDLIEGGTSFIIWSLVLRVIDSLGAAAATVSSFSLVSCVFSDNIATIMVN